MRSNTSRILELRGVNTERSVSGNLGPSMWNRICCPFRHFRSMCTGPRAEWFSSVLVSIGFIIYQVRRVERILHSCGKVQPNGLVTAVSEMIRTYPTLG